MSWCNHSSVNGPLPPCTPDEAVADFRRDARPAPASENEALQLVCVDHRRVFVCPVRRAHVGPREGGGRDDTFHRGDSPSNDRRGRGGVGHGCSGRIGVVPGRYRRTLAAVLSPVGLGNRGLVAVLLRGAGAGKRVSGSSHRQAVDGPRDRPGAHPAGRAGERVGAAGIVAITAGTLLMVEPSDLSGLPRALRGGGSWLVYALASALFAALTSILGKVGISGVDPTLGTAVRTVVVLAMAWVIVTVQGRLGDVRDIPRVSWPSLSRRGRRPARRGWRTITRSRTDPPPLSYPSTSCRFSSPLPSRRPCFTSVSRAVTWRVSPSCARAREPWWWRRAGWYRQRAAAHHSVSTSGPSPVSRTFHAGWLAGQAVVACQPS